MWGRVWLLSCSPSSSPPPATPQGAVEGLSWQAGLLPRLGTILGGPTWGEWGTRLPAQAPSLQEGKQPEY